jgi:hypothetical protein
LLFFFLHRQRDATLEIGSTVLVTYSPSLIFLFFLGAYATIFGALAARVCVQQRVASNGELPRFFLRESISREKKIRSVV